MNTNLRYLLFIRMIAIGGQILALAMMQWLFAIQFPPVPVITVIVILGIVTFITWRQLERGKEVSERIFVMQLLTDVMALTVLIYFTGGSANPFISLFILPIIFAAASIHPVCTSFIALSAIACYTFLMFFNVPVLHSHIQNSGIQLHIWGMWFGFILSAGLVAYFVSRMAQALRNREHALAVAREDALRADKAVALGTLAAGTAHELGTPLSTIALLSKELELEYAQDSRLVHDLSMLREQAAECKSILARMSSDAGQTQADAGHVADLDSYLEEIVDDWQKLRSDITIHVNFSKDGTAPRIIVDKTLTQAIMNVLNNAADASTHSVEFTASWTDGTLLIRVRDDGPGLSPQVQTKVGEDIISSKPQGLGIGLLLAQITLNRFGGQFYLNNSDQGGTNATIEIPLKPLMVI